MKTLFTLPSPATTGPSRLVARHKRRVLSTASRFARDNHQIDDLAQEIFLRAYRKLGKFRGDAPFEHWLSRVTITTCYDFLRRERKTREQISLEAFLSNFATLRTTPLRPPRPPANCSPICSAGSRRKSSSSLRSVSWKSALSAKSLRLPAGARAMSKSALSARANA